MSPSIVVFVLSAAIMPTQASPSGVYTWTDAQGRVHYSDTPPPAQQAERLRTGRVDPAATHTARSRLAEQLTGFELRHRQMRADEAKQQAEQQEALKRQQDCERARNQYARLQQAGLRFVRTGADGRQQVLSETERAEALAQTRRYLEQHCP